MRAHSHDGATQGTMYTVCTLIIHNEFVGLLLTLSFSACAVWSVPGGPVPRHHRPRAFSRSWRMVSRKRRPAYSNLSKGRVCNNHQSQGVQTSQESHEDHHCFCWEWTGEQRGKTLQCFHVIIAPETINQFDTVYVITSHHNGVCLCLSVSQEVQSLRKEVKDLKAAIEELTKRVSELESKH